MNISGNSYLAISPILFSVVMEDQKVTGKLLL